MVFFVSFIEAIKHKANTVKIHEFITHNKTDSRINQKPAYGSKQEVTHRKAPNNGSKSISNHCTNWTIDVNDWQGSSNSIDGFVCIALSIRQMSVVRCSFFSHFKFREKQKLLLLRQNQLRRPFKHRQKKRNWGKQSDKNTRIMRAWVDYFIWDCTFKCTAYA